MGLVTKTVKPSEAAAINNEGASTDEEREQSIADHEAEFHAGGPETPGYYDPDRGVYLATQEYKVIFSYDGSSTFSSVYLYYVPRIKSSTIPFKIIGTDHYTIVAIEVYTKDNESGTIMWLQDKANGYSNVYSIDVGSSKKELLIEGLDIRLNPGVQLACESKKSIADPIVILTLKKILTVS